MRVPPLAINFENLTREQLVDLATLLHQQEEAYDESRLDLYVPHTGGPSGGQLAFHKSDAKIRLVCTGNRCVAGETKIYDPVHDRTLRIDEIYRPFFVFAWNGDKLVPAKASKPFQKGVDDLYRVTFSDGNEILCTLKHKLLTPEGYIEVQKLLVGSFVSAPYRPFCFGFDTSSANSPKLSSLSLSGKQSQVESSHTLNNKILHLLFLGLGSFALILKQTIFFARRKFSTCRHLSTLALDRLVHVLGGLNFYQTAQDFLWSCFAYSRPCGGLPLVSREVGQGFVPLQAYVQEHISRVAWDGLGRKQEYNHSYQSLVRLSNLGVQSRNEDRFFDRLFQTFCKQTKYVLGLLQVHFQSICEFSRWLSNPSAYRLAKQSSFSLLTPSSSVLVTSIKYERRDVYYDLSVPEYGNYYACGTIQKNSGKTTSSVLEAIWLALGTHPYHPILIPNRTKMYTNSFPMVMETFKIKFDEWLPVKFLDSKKSFIHDQKGNLTGINFANGSIIRFGAYEQMSDKAEGSSWHNISFDEPPPRDLYVANMRGLVDHGGKVWFTMTPLREPWIKDELWDPGISGAKPYIHCFEGASDDNPHIDKESLNLFLGELTEAEKEVRYYGRFKKLQGLVIDTFDEDQSLIDPFELDSNFVLFEGIDPHSKKANAALWKAIDIDGYRYVVDELSCSSGIYEFGKQVAAKRRALTKNGARLLRCVADTSLNQVDMMFKMNQKDEFCRALRDEGEEVMPAMAQKRDWILPGIQKIKDLYRPIVHTEGELARPTQYVFKNCRQYLKELNHYQWPETEKDGIKPIPVWNELIDCDRYCESIAPKFQTPGQKGLIQNNSGAYQRLNRFSRQEGGLWA